MEMRGLVALVTGAGSGLGRALSISAATRGMRVIVTGRNEKHLEETARLIAEKGGECDVFKLDVTNTQSISSLAEEIRIQCGGLDLLINNAAFFSPKSSLIHTSLLNWDMAFDTNVRGPFLMLKAFLPMMIAQSKGYVINICSHSYLMPSHTAYTASKNALKSLTQLASCELEGSGVEIYGIEPPFLDTKTGSGESPLIVSEKIFATLFDGDLAPSSKTIRIE